MSDCRPDISTGGPRCREPLTGTAQAQDKLVDVAIAVIWRSSRAGVEVLATRRPAGVHLPGAWEFPGGKIHQGESPAEAARREAAEEVGLNLTELQPLITVEHAYPERSVRLHAQLSRVEASAVPQNLQVLEHRWIPLGQLRQIPWPAANGPVVAAIVDHLNFHGEHPAADDLTTCQG